MMHCRRMPVVSNVLYFARSVGRGGAVRAGGFVDFVFIGRIRQSSDIETGPSRWNIYCRQPVHVLPSD